jgi:predicted dehydrogenase
MRVQWAILGCGDIANKRVAPAINDQPDSDLIAFYSHSQARAEEFAARHGARRAYSDLEALLEDPEVNAVYIASPPDLHCPQTVAAAEAGKQVLCEKPMALNVEEGRRMIEACAAHGVHLAIAYYRRWFPKARRMKALLEAGALGTVLHGTIALVGTYRPTPDDPKYWRVQMARAGGGNLMDTGSHRLDLLCYLLGPPESVAGFADRLVMDFEVPDTESLLIRMACGAHIVSRHSFATANFRDDFELFGTRGCLLATPFDGPRLTAILDGQEQTFDLPPHPNVHYPLIDDFARALVEGRAPEFDGLDGLQATRIMSGCYESARTGRVVRV